MSIRIPLTVLLGLMADTDKAAPPKPAFPHCDPLLLHANGTCHSCDQFRRAQVASAPASPLRPSREARLRRLDLYIANVRGQHREVCTYRGPRCGFCHQSAPCHAIQLLKPLENTVRGVESLIRFGELRRGEAALDRLLDVLGLNWVETPGTVEKTVTVAPGPPERVTVAPKPTIDLSIAAGFLRYLQRDGFATDGISRRLLPDHACKECVPHGEIVIAGFRCQWHTFKAAVEERTLGKVTPDPEARV